MHCYKTIHWRFGRVPEWHRLYFNGHFTYTNFNILGQIPLDLGGGGQTFDERVCRNCQKKSRLRRAEILPPSTTSPPVPAGLGSQPPGHPFQLECNDVISQSHSNTVKCYY